MQCDICQKESKHILPFGEFALGYECGCFENFTQELDKTKYIKKAFENVAERKMEMRDFFKEMWSTSRKIIKRGD